MMSVHACAHMLWPPAGPIPDLSQSCQRQLVVFSKVDDSRLDSIA